MVQSDSGEYTVLAAQVAGAHGVSGSLRLRLIGEHSDAAARSLPSGRTVRLTRAEDDFSREVTLKGMRKQPKGVWIAQFKEITDRTEAEAFHGCAVMIREGERAVLPEGEYYVDQLLGLSVVTDQERSLGKLIDVLNTPANDVYVTDEDALIPAAGDFIVSVSLEDQKIVVRDVPGLHGGE